MTSLILAISLMGFTNHPAQKANVVQKSSVQKASPVQKGVQARACSARACSARGNRGPRLLRATSRIRLFGNRRSRGSGRGC